MAEKVVPFSGNLGATESPQDFLRTFQRIHFDTDETLAINRFPFYVKSGHDADDWFNGLTTTQTANWTAFKAAFSERWPKSERAAKQQGEYEDEILKLRFREEELGKKVDDGGIEVWTHVKWANDTLQLVTKAGLATSSSYIQPVRRHLPDVLKVEIGFTHADWTAFTKAIRSVNVEAIFDHIERTATKAKDDARMRAMIQTVTDTRATRLRVIPLSTLPVQPTHIQPGVAPGFTAQQRTPSGYPNAFIRGGHAGTFASPNEGRRPQERQPLSEDERRNLSRLLDLLPHHPPTANGNELYTRQISDWTALHGHTARPSATNPYPLRPGTAGLCSGECFRCGTHGHRSFACPHPPETQVPRNEVIWRALCSRELGTIRAPNANHLPPTAVNLVYITDELGHVHIGGYDEDTQNEDEQGNGEGSSA